ncbi:MAG: hypothetical protein H0U75_07795 [Legionella sp.]|nr:hypothetical protein [Legionella sp.]
MTNIKIDKAQVDYVIKPPRTRLDLSYGKLNDSSHKFINDFLLSNPTCTTLVLRGCILRSISFLDPEVSSKIKVLDLASNQLNGAAIVDLIEQCSALETLNLSSNPITDVDVKSLCKARALQTLTLHNTNISDEGAKLLANIPTLTSVDVCDNQHITIKGLQYFARNFGLRDNFAFSNFNNRFHLGSIHNYPYTIEPLITINPNIYSTKKEFHIFIFNQRFYLIEYLESICESNRRLLISHLQFIRESINSWIGIAPLCDLIFDYIGTSNVFSTQDYLPLKEARDEEFSFLQKLDEAAVAKQHTLLVQQVLFLYMVISKGNMTWWRNQFFFRNIQSVGKLEQSNNVEMQHALSITQEIQGREFKDLSSKKTYVKKRIYNFLDSQQTWLKRGIIPIEQQNIVERELNVMPQEALGPTI